MYNKIRLFIRLCSNSLQPDGAVDKYLINKYIYGDKVDDQLLNKIHKLFVISNNE